jgi:hypothetical protein
MSLNYTRSTEWKYEAVFPRQAYLGQTGVRHVQGMGMSSGFITWSRTESLGYVATSVVQL